VLRHTTPAFLGLQAFYNTSNRYLARALAKHLKRITSNSRSVDALRLISIGPLPVTLQALTPPASHQCTVTPGKDKSLDATINSDAVVVAAQRARTEYLRARGICVTVMCGPQNLPLITSYVLEVGQPEHSQRGSAEKRWRVWGGRARCRHFCAREEQKELAEWEALKTTRLQVGKRSRRTDSLVARWPQGSGLRAARLFNLRSPVFACISVR
jgi:hypothetical protein